MMLLSLDGMNQMYRAELPEYNQMDLTYLMQNGAFKGFGSGPGHAFRIG